MLKGFTQRSDFPDEEPTGDAPEHAEVGAGSSRHGRGARHGPKLWLALAPPLLACGIGGSKEPWVLGLLAFLVGLNLIAAPPRSRVPKAILWPLVVFALWLLGGFLPLGEDSVPPWRATFGEDYGIDLGNRRTPQPWVSFEIWVLILLGLTWLWHCLGRGFNEGERRWLMRMLIGMTVVLAILAVWFKRAGIDISFWQREWRLNYFGPFPNRNNFGGLLAMAAVLTFAVVYDAYRRRSPWWLVYAGAMIPIVWALVSNTARGGLVLFFGGLMAWMAFGSFSRRSARRMGVAAAILIALVAVIILFGQHILERFTFGDSLDDVPASSRLRIWSDSLDLIGKAPIFGQGLGCFAAPFAFSQTWFHTVARHLHPESDWLWIAAEAGLPAAILLLSALVNYVRRTGLGRAAGDDQSRTDRRLRNACAIAALILPFHALIDTPAHTLGLTFTAALLAGASLRARRAVEGGATAPLNRKARLLLAGGCAAAGAAWCAVSAGMPAMPGLSSARMFERRAQQLDYRDDHAGALASLNRALALAPLQWDYYYERATISLAMRLPPQKALEDFARARYLVPHSGLLCNAEALVWMKYHPSFAPAAWREGIRRDPSRAESFYGWAIGALREHPELRPAVRNLANSPKLKVTYLMNSEKTDFDDALKDILETQPDLEGFSPEERLLIFRRWHATGDRAQLVAQLEKNAAWRSDGWPVLAADRAARGDFVGAYQLAVEFLPAPTEGTGGRKGDINQLRREFLFHPTESSYGFDLFEAEKGKGLVNDALVTLEKIAQIPNAPPRVLYEQAVLLARKGEHAAAWDKMRAYIEKHQVAARESSKEPEVKQVSRSELQRLLRGGG